MDRLPPFRDFSFFGFLPARSRLALQLVCGLLLVSLVVAQGLCLAGSRPGASADSSSLTAPSGVEWSTAVTPPLAERTCGNEEFSKRAKAIDLALDELSLSGRTTSICRGKDSDLAAHSHRAATLMDLQVRLQI